MTKDKTYFTKNNPDFLGKVVSDTPRADGKNTFTTNSDGYSKETVVKVPLGQPTMNRVGGQKRMLASKKSSVKWW